MVTESRASKPHLSAVESVVENEISTYRAISVLAIISLLVGVVALLCFASLWFLPAAVAAPVLGYLGLRRIARYPDMLTGAGLAKAGIALGLISGLAATTSTVVQSFLLRQRAQAFAQTYVDVLNTKDYAAAVWYRAMPDSRKDKDPQAILDEYTASAGEPNMLEMEFGGLRELKGRIDTRQYDVHLAGIEDYGVIDLVPFANILIEVHKTGADAAGKAHDHNGEVTYALATAKATAKEGRYDWFVESLSYPYTPNTMKRPGPKIDDGHGHGH